MHITKPVAVELCCHATALIVILVIFRYGFEGMTIVLIAKDYGYCIYFTLNTPVPGHCLLVTSKMEQKRLYNITGGYDKR